MWEKILGQFGAYCVGAGFGFGVALVGTALYDITGGSVVSAVSGSVALLVLGVSVFSDIKKSDRVSSQTANGLSFGAIVSLGASAPLFFDTVDVPNPALGAELSVGDLLPAALVIPLTVLVYWSTDVLFKKWGYLLITVGFLLSVASEFVAGTVESAVLVLVLVLLVVGLALANVPESV